jgi:tRNA-Thr(GGU) m(6)t(6)A37 methyltransferase TsaA
LDRSVTFNFIGYIHTPFEEKTGVPIQACYSRSEGWIELFPEFFAGLLDLEGFSHLILIYHFHKINKVKMQVKPYLEEKKHGIFATRAPIRPNPIGISTVELMGIDKSKSILKIRGVDMLNNSPLIDIKPFVPHFDNREGRSGWLSSTNHTSTRPNFSDNRF